MVEVSWQHGMVFQEMSEMFLAFNNRGIPVKISGVGTFTPSIGRHGDIRHNFRAAKELKKGSTVADTYHGEIINRERIGLSDEE